VAARRLPSGDIVVTLATVVARKEIQLETSWLKAFGDGAKIKRQVYIVIAYGINIAQVNTDKQDEAIKEIFRQNRQLQENVEVLAVY
jgi:hypothetical protein